MTDFERRRHMRISLAGGEVRLVSGALLEQVGRLIDISLGGLKFSSTFEFGVGDAVTLEVGLPNGRRFTCTARILRRESALVYGAQFDVLGIRDQFDLGDFITKKRTNPDTAYNSFMN